LPAAELVRSRTNNLLRRRAQNNVRRFGIEPEIEFMARIIHELGVAGVWADAPAHKDKSLCQFCKVWNEIARAKSVIGPPS
jgi:hypothetical protein